MEKFINNVSDFFNKYKLIFHNPLHKNQNSYDVGCTTKFSVYPDSQVPFSTNCIKCMKYLEHLDGEYLKEGEQKQGIIYLYLWLHYYELQNNIHNAKTLDNMEKLIESYEEMYNGMPNIKYIYDNGIKNILNDKLKDLYYLNHKFYNFKNNKECGNDRCTCAQECVNTYKNSLDKCNKPGNVFLCNELENFREQYNIYMPSATDCPDVDSYLPSHRIFSTSVIILISFTTISVLSSLVFILYKFTPFGSCNRFRSKRPQRMYSNFTNEEANLLYTRGGSRTPEAKPYNIAYNSI